MYRFLYTYIHVPDPHTLLTHMDSYNYTFNSMGTVGAVVLLNFMALPVVDKAVALSLHAMSLGTIVVVNIVYCRYYQWPTTQIRTPISITSPPPTSLPTSLPTSPPTHIPLHTSS